MDLGKRIASQLEAATFERIAGVGLENAAVNRPKIERSILELGDVALGDGDSAVVVGAGPSLHRRDSLARLRKSGYTGTVVAVDGALGSCLRAGVVPHLVVSVDPHRERIVRWFGDPAMTAAPADDYFRRQEMDPAQAADEVAANRGLVGIDFGYPPGTPYERTQYYPELRGMFGDRYAEAFIPVDSPFVGERWFTDPAYYWFRTVFLDMAREADAETVNCTEGGVLHGDSVPLLPLEDFLAKADRRE